MEQGHELGTFLRNRYNGHISTKYNLSDVSLYLFSFLFISINQILVIHEAA